MRLDGQAVLVVGAGAGIGRAVALAVGAAGAGVGLVGRGEAALEATAVRIGEAGGTSWVLPGDITVEADVRAAVELLLTAAGRIDGLVCGGNTTNVRGRLHELTDSDWSRTLDLHVTGAMRCIRAVLPVMREAGSGSIVAISSAAGVRALPDVSIPAYAVAKAALNHLVRVTAIEYAADGIRANAVVAGAVATRSLANPEAAAVAGRLHPVGRIAAPEEIAELVLYLLAPESSFVTGALMNIDGGVTS